MDPRLLFPSSRLGRALAALPATFFFASCASTGELARSAEPAPAAWKTVHVAGSGLDRNAIAVWWERFEDPVLSRLITVALKQNPDLATARSRIEESRSRRQSERANLLPSLSANAAGSGQRTDPRGAGATVSNESYSASVDAAWELDLFGKLRQSARAADADFAQSRENLYAAQVALAAEIAGQYTSLRSAEKQKVVVEQTIAAQADTLSLVRWREEVGAATALGTQQTVSAVEQAKATLPSLHQTIEQARNELALLAGELPGSFDALLQPARDLPHTPAALAVGIPAETLRQRPDVRAAEQALIAAHARTRSAEAKRLPTLSLSGSVGVDALRAGRLTSPDAVVSSLVGNLSAPLFAGGSIRAAITVQQEQEKQAYISYQSAVRTALRDVENALIAVRRTGEGLDIVGRAVTAARDAADLSRQQFEAGEVDLLVVLDAQRTWLALEKQRVGTEADRLSAHVQLYKALGGGWANPS